MKRRSDCVAKFLEENQALTEFSFDTETTGLYAYQGHRPFSLQVSSEVGDYYFTNKDEWLTILRFLNRKGNLLYAHNIKFDMHMLWKDQGFLFDTAVLWDTLAMARLIDNTRLKYDLYSACQMFDIPTEFGKKTEELVKLAIEQIKKEVNATTKDKTQKIKLANITYAMVPDDIMAPYAIEDTRLTLLLGKVQRRKLAQPALRPIRDLELQVTKVLFEVERRGIKLDKDYCKVHAEKLDKRCEEISLEISRQCGFEWKDSAVMNRKVFEALGIPLLKSFDKNNLPKAKHPIVTQILEFRALKKISSTYFHGFLDLCGDDGFLRPNFNQNVTTGRMSCTAPNLQNLKKGAEATEGEATPIAVKEALLPPSDEYVIVQADYSAQEYRLAFDIAEEEGLIAKVKEGLDIHTATAQFLSEGTGKEFSRQQAKTINFLLLYGGGNQKLADALKISLDQAKSLKEMYFSQLPKIKELVEETRNRMKSQKVVESWLGRQFKFNQYFLKAESISEDELFSYPEWKQEQIITKGGTYVDNSNSAFNATIQGGSADITKIAMVNFHKLLAQGNYKSHIVCLVHDAIYLALHKSETELISKLEDTMVKAYPHKYLPMGVDIVYGANFFEELPIENLQLNIAI